MKFLFGIPLLFTLSGCIADPYYDDSYSYTETTRTQYIPSGSSMIYTETVVRPQIYYQPAPLYVYPRPVYRPYYRIEGQSIDLIMIDRGMITDLIVRTDLISIMVMADLIIMVNLMVVVLIDRVVIEINKIKSSLMVAFFVTNFVILLIYLMDKEKMFL